MTNPEAMTCGAGLAQHAAEPLKMAEVLDALAETLELHREMLVLADEKSKREDDVYRELALEYRDVAARLRDTATKMQKQRDLPMGAHDESKWSDRHLKSFERFVRAESALAADLRAASERDDKMLRSMK
jgi:hypothetical protein